MKAAARLSVAFIAALTFSSCSSNGDDAPWGHSLVSCASGEQACGAQCVTVANDPHNCGGCGIPCGASETCQSGVCTCSGVVSCNGACSPSDAPVCAPAATLPALVTSAPGTYWKTDETPHEVSDGVADLVVDETASAQVWEGFGGAFNEMGWDDLALLSEQDRARALDLLFGEDGARFAFGRIPIGASDYATDRYTLDETPGDFALAGFSIARDQQKLIPFIKAAKGVNARLRLWASPWTPPTWMKDGPFQAGKAPSPFDGGSMKSDEATLDAFARYLTKFVQAYAQEGLVVEAVSAQNEPGYSGNYPTCLWTPSTYTAFIGGHLGPTLTAAGLGTKILLGTFNGGGQDTSIVRSVMADATARPYVDALGYQWGMVAHVAQSQSYDVPIWQTEHKAGNYPWLPSFNADKAPNDDAFAVESWGLIRDWINAGVNAYSAWNLVLDTAGRGIDTTRNWPQDALLTVDPDTHVLNVTPTYYIFRHVSQFVRAGARVVSVKGGDALAFKNPDGTTVVVTHNAGPARSMIVSAGGKKTQVAVPAQGWATVVVSPALASHS